MTPALALLLVALLIAGNALFVAAEFSLVASSRGVMEQRADEGDRAARRVLEQLRNLSFVLSAAQFGITATSLLVGFLAEDAIGDVVVRPVLEAMGAPAASTTGVSVAAAFLLSTMVQMVVGELAPKNIAIARPDRTAIATSLPMVVFGVVFGPVIRVFDAAAAWLTRKVFRVDVTEELAGGLTLEELSRIITASGEEGTLSDHQADLLGRAVSLRDRRAGEVMVPRPDITWVEADQPVADLRVAARTSGHSRFPVRDGERVVGTVHLKDLMAVPADRHARTTMAEIAAPTLLVPQSETVRSLLMRFRSEARTFAVVVDEYGVVIGLLTLEDVLEQLVGHIEDEHDPREEPPVRRLGRGRFLVSGRLPVEHIGDLTGVRLPQGGYETVAGFVIDRLGRIPDVRDEATWDGLRFVVTRMDDARVAQLRVVPVPEAAAAEERQARADAVGDADPGDRRSEQ